MCQEKGVRIIHEHEQQMLKRWPSKRQKSRTIEAERQELHMQCRDPRSSYLELSNHHYQFEPLPLLTTVF